MSIQIACSKTRQEELDKVQNNALRMICGGMRSTPTAATEIMTNVEPLGMRREKATVETYERCKRMPTNHPAKILVDKWVPKNRIKSQSILHHAKKLREKTILPDNRKPLLKTLKVPPNKQPIPPDINSKLFGNEKITKKSDPLTLKTAAEKTILNYPENWTHVYTDGSADEATKNAGWGVWIQKPNGVNEELYDAWELTAQIMMQKYVPWGTALITFKSSLMNIHIQQQVLLSSQIHCLRLKDWKVEILMKIFLRLTARQKNSDQHTL